VQKLCVKLGNEKLEKMEPNFKKMWITIFEKHLVVIEKFGRFPHRNNFLTRHSTPAELEFVNDPKFRFDLPVKLTVDPLTGAAGFHFIMAGNGDSQDKDKADAELPAKERYESHSTVVRTVGFQLDSEAEAMVIARRRSSNPRPEKIQAIQRSAALRILMMQRSTSWASSIDGDDYEFYEF